ncbi:MAG: DUF2200 domain-containing protein [Tissierellales bacterium]|nr:DUF2200 domain-containing protein [Tissierellales bacterium]
MENHKIYNMPFSQVYDLYIKKVERKGKNIEDIDKIIMWLTGYNKDELNKALENNVTFEEFFGNAKELNPNREKINGTICGIKIQEMSPSLMKEIRYLDKLIDELANGKAMEKILRS